MFGTCRCNVQRRTEESVCVRAGRAASRTGRVGGIGQGCRTWDMCVAGWLHSLAGLVKRRLSGYVKWHHVAARRDSHHNHHLQHR